MIRSSRSQYLRAGFLVLLTSVTMAISSVGQVYAANLGNVAPWPANTQPISEPGGNGTVFLLRKNPAAGASQDIRLSIYLPSSAIGSTSLTLSPGTNSSDSFVCNRGSNPGGNFMRVTFVEPTQPQSKMFRIPWANACTEQNRANSPGDPGNVLYARYPLSGLGTPTSVESKTQMYKVDVTIDFDAPATVDNVVRFRIAASMPGVPGAILSPGTGSLSYPTVADWDEIVQSGNNSPKRIIVPFGQCENSNTPVNRNITLYDADNGPSSSFAPNVLTYRVFDLTTGAYVAFTSTSGGSLSNANTTVTPDPGNSANVTASFSLIPSHFYEMRIYQVANANTIDIRLPTGSESIWGVPAACQVPIPDPVEYDNVVLTSGISQSGDVEVGGSVTFNQNVTISNFPWRPSQWGFNEEAIRVAWNTNTPPVQTNYDANNAGPTGLTGTAERQCQSGWAANCANYTCHNGSIRTAATGCGAAVGYYRWRCEWNGKYEPASGWVNQANAPACGNIIQYQCRDAAGNWQNQFRDFSGRANNACSNMWNCWAPSGRPNTFDPNYGAGYCRVFRCAYDANPANYFYSPPGNNADDQCDKRCSAGTGAPAPNWTGPGSDDNCYIRPSFTVTCTFDTGVSVSEVVQDNGVYCDGLPNSSIVKSGASRGQLCAVTTASNTPWQGTLPGKGVDGNVNQMRVIWGFDLNTPASACAQVGQRPYFHVYGGDVNAKTSFMPCTVPNTTTIQAWNTGIAPNYPGSGVQLAALARGTIDGFTSSSISTNKPTGLTFANTTSGYGGGFLGNLDCIPDTDLPPTGASTSVSGLVTTQDWRNYGNQDVYITGDITYPANFSLNAIPSLKIITNGNIYIASTVRQVSGTFIAKGKIYTCAVANGAGGLRAPTPAEMARPVSVPENCESQLRVNGSFIANQVKLLRTIGSVSYTPVDGDARNGTGLGTAAELFNYTPDVWLRDLADPTPGGGDLPTESFVNLPPIL